MPLEQTFLHPSMHVLYQQIAEEDIFDHKTAVEEVNRRIFGYSNPLRVRWFFSVIGAEYCHTYFWLIKDLAWMQGMVIISVSFGIAALLWSMLILWHALRTSNWQEVWNFVALFLWLFANYWWMVGEAHDLTFPEESPVSSQNVFVSTRVLEIALIWILIYYVVILPLRILHVDPASIAEYDNGLLKPRCSVFENFRQYENMHMLLWILKDLAWIRNNIALWAISLAPTILVAVDFIILASSRRNKDASVDVVHYVAQLLWVVSNTIWAFGDFFINEYDEPLRFWTRSGDSFWTARWYSSWVLLLALMIILVHYGVWIYLTVRGKLQPTEMLLRVGGRGQRGSGATGTIIYTVGPVVTRNSSKYHAMTLANSVANNGSGQIKSRCRFPLNSCALSRYCRLCGCTQIGGGSISSSNSSSTNNSSANNNSIKLGTVEEYESRCCRVGSIFLEIRDELCRSVALTESKGISPMAKQGKDDHTDTDRSASDHRILGHKNKSVSGGRLSFRTLSNADGMGYEKMLDRDSIPSV